MKSKTVFWIIEWTNIQPQIILDEFTTQRLYSNFTEQMSVIQLSQLDWIVMKNCRQTKIDSAKPSSRVSYCVCVGLYLLAKKIIYWWTTIWELSSMLRLWCTNHNCADHATCALIFLWVLLSCEQHIQCIIWADRCVRWIVILNVWH